MRCRKQGSTPSIRDVQMTVGLNTNIRRCCRGRGSYTGRRYRRAARMSETRKTWTRERCTMKRQEKNCETLPLLPASTESKRLDPWLPPPMSSNRCKGHSPPDLLPSVGVETATSDFTAASVSNVERVPSPSLTSFASTSSGSTGLSRQEEDKT